MNIKDIEIWTTLFSSIKEIWLLILVYFVFNILKLLNKNDLHQSKNVENMKILLKNTLLFTLMTVAAIVYLLGMFSLSLNSYPKKEVLQYIYDWNNFGPFIILIIIYAMLFPMSIMPFLGEQKNKKYFVEKCNNIIIEREIIDRFYINGNDKLILKDSNGFQIEKNVTDTDNLTFKIQNTKSWLTMENIENAFSNFQNKSKRTRIFLFICIFLIPTFYFAWNVQNIIDMFTKLQKWTDVYMYIGILTLPAIVIIGLYYVIYNIYYVLFTRSIPRVIKDIFKKIK